LHGLRAVIGRALALSSNRFSEAPMLLTYPTEGKNTLSQSFNFCLSHLASFQSFVVASSSLKRNHVGNGYVLGSSAHLEVCNALPRTTPLVADTDSEQDSRCLGLLPLDCGLHGRAVGILRSMAHSLYFAVSAADMEIHNTFPHHGERSEYHLRHVFL
jgi:hypothetical protein